MDIKTLRKRSLVIDFVCILVAGVVLFCGTRQLMPEWLMVIGLLVSLAALCFAIYYAHKARKLEQRDLERLLAEQEKQLKEEKRTATHEEDDGHV